jgi:trk system potassium uptake protein TrkH
MTVLPGRNVLVAQRFSPEQRRIIRLVLDAIMAIVGVGSIATLIVEFGFYLTLKHIEFIDTTVTVFITLFIFQEVIRWMLALRPREFLRERRVELVITTLLLLQLFFPGIVRVVAFALIPDITIEQLALLYLAVTQLTIVLSLIIRAIRYNRLVATIKLPPGALFIISFILIIAAGTLLLLLPRSTIVPLGLLDTLFTATSAVCVIGLTVTDTATAFTPLGKFIILVLIQVGGLGIMTLTTFFAIFFSGGISVRERLLMSALLSEENIGEVSSILFRITLLTFSIEAIGAVLLYWMRGGALLSFDPYLFYSCIFHSVSAFCNAGFSLYSNGLYEESIRNNYAYHSVIMILVVLGSLGFAVLSESLRVLQVWKPRMYRIQNRLSVFARLSLLMAAILVIGGAVSIYLLESSYSFRGLGTADALFHSLFLSVTCRTAGFNIWPMHVLSAPTIFVMMLLMWIGASPGSTGGGIKTTTLAIAVLNIRNTLLERGRLEIFFRQISYESVRKAFTIILLSIFFIAGATILIVFIEPGKNPLDLMFEIISAMGTTGLSRNVTGLLGTGAKWLVIATMFVGRVGILTLLYAFVKPVGEPHYKFPEENILVG